VSVTGYLFGVGAVLLGLVALVVLAVKAPRLGFLFLAALVVVVVAALVAGVSMTSVGVFVAGLTGALLLRWVAVLMAVLTVWACASWALLAVRAFRSTAASDRFEAWLVRHRRAITIVAALGPIPYALARITWLTPWPLFSPSVEALDSVPGARLTGLVIGAGAAAASILTLGLILPWGLTFPRWMPRVGASPVPVWFAAVPGFAAAAVLCVSAVPMLLINLEGSASIGEAVKVNLVLPVWLWGPALALAVWAYVAFRREHAPVLEPATDRPTRLGQATAS
jgi:hypothetical protein